MNIKRRLRRTFCLDRRNGGLPVPVQLSARLSLLVHYSARQTADCWYPFKLACAHERFNGGRAPRSCFAKQNGRCCFSFTRPRSRKCSQRRLRTSFCLEIFIPRATTAKPTSVLPVMLCVSRKVHAFCRSVFLTNQRARS